MSEEYDFGFTPINRKIIHKFLNGCFVADVFRCDGVLFEKLFNEWSFFFSLLQSFIPYCNGDNNPAFCVVNKTLKKAATCQKNQC